jgi:acetylornithine deacetylase/succinyl-diaminopimelate desuccinylase-like protein
MNRILLNRAVGVAACILAAVVFEEAQAQARGQVTPDLTQELAAVRQVLSSPQMTAALRYVDESDEETLQEFLQVCSAPGPSQDETYRSHIISRLLQIYGLDKVHLDDENNVIGVRPGTGDGPTVVLNAHHDNVRIWPKNLPYQAFIADGRVWCPAARDDLIGTVQVLTALRALNAGNVHTRGDVWFVFLVGEEPLNHKRSPGSEFFVNSNVPHNITWRDGDIMVQLHGGGGEGVSTGHVNLRHSSQLRVFMPIVRPQWRWHAVDVLGKIMARVTDEVRPTAAGRNTGRDDEFMVMKMTNPHPSGRAMNESVSEASVRFNLQIQTEQRAQRAHDHIQRIAQEVCAEMGEGCSVHYTINTRNGTEEGIPGFDNVNNSAARFAAATARALYNTEGYIAPRSGCGDCVRAYRNGMPAFSLRGNVIDRGGGDFSVGRSGELESQVRRVTEDHDVTDSVPIENIWAGAKHAALFIVSYTGLAGQPAQDGR